MLDPKTNPVLYLSYDGLTDPLGQSQILPYVVGLAKKGWRFTVISFEKPSTFEQNHASIQAACDMFSITWIPLVYHKRPPVLSTIFDLWLLWRKAKSIVQHNPCYIVHCRSYITSIVGLHLKRNQGAKFVFDMRGFWADERVEAGLWNLKNPIFWLVFKYFKWQEQNFIKGADLIISLTHNAKKEIESWHIQHSEIKVIPTCVDLELFDPARINPVNQKLLRTQLGITPTDFVLLYLGSWGTWYQTEEMIEYFKNIKQKQRNAKFLIVTPDYVELNTSLRVDTIVTKARRDQVPLYISLASEAVCFIRPTYSKKASAATKIAELLAMEVPVITNPGWGDIESLESGGIVQFHHNRQNETPPPPLREYCRLNYSLSTAIEQVNALYKSLSSNQRFRLLNNFHLKV